MTALRGVLSILLLMAAALAFVVPGRATSLGVSPGECLTKGELGSTALQRCLLEDWPDRTLIAIGSLATSWVVLRLRPRRR